MISLLDPSGEAFLANVGRIQQRITQANNEVSSGKRILAPSDAPDQISALLQLRSNLQRNTQIQNNLSMAQAEASNADDALTSAIQLMDTALTTGAQGASTTADAASRQSLAQKIDAIQGQMVAYSQTTVQGRYIFGGDQDGNPSYSYDPSKPQVGVDRLFTSPMISTRLIEDPAGGSFPATMMAQKIFDDTDALGNPTANNVFAGLNALRVALLNNDTNGITTAITSVKSATDYLNTTQAFYGNVLVRVQNAQAFADSYDTKLQAQISQKEDADIVAAATELTMGNTQLQAAFQSRAKMPHTTLWDFLG